MRYYQINDNWFNEPFAVSPYRLLILRHAWLNLWDKHMTTGRINQVTILTARLGPRPEPRELRPRAERVAAWFGVQPQLNPWTRGSRDRDQREPSVHPIAPAEFPKRRSAIDVGIRDPEGRPTLRHTPLGWRTPAAHHVRRRLQALVDPRKHRYWWWPTAKDPQTPSEPTGRAMGLQAKRPPKPTGMVSWVGGGRMGRHTSRAKANAYHEGIRCAG